MVTREQFIQHTGREPADDDLERVNCMDAGRAGHLCCGWNYEQMKPQFELGPREWNGLFPHNTPEEAMARWNERRP